MRLEEIQPNLKTIISAIEMFAAVQTLIVPDDGLQEEAMEAALKDPGLFVLIMLPQALKTDDSTRGAAKLGYSTAVWVRTNPKVLNDAATAPKWNVLLCEQEILNAVLKWSKGRSDFGFMVTPGLEPETDWMDSGNVTRLVRFTTGVHFQ
jgi:hypothetical protein